MQEKPKIELIARDKTHEIIGCAMHALNTIGHGFSERTYENAMAVGLKKQGIPFTQQKRFVINYMEESIGEHIPDLVINDEIVVEIKTIDRITHHEKGQVINYLKVTGLKVGLILNFKYAKLEWERLVL